MAEDSYLRVTREYFTDTNAIALDIPVGKLNKAIEKYNVYLQKCLVDESPHVAMNLKLTIEKSMQGELESQKDDGKQKD